MLRSSFCHYSDAYKLMSGTMKITGAGVNDAEKRLDKRNKGVIYKNNTQIDHAKDLDVVMSMFNLVEYTNNYSKTCGNLRKFYRDEPAVAMEVSKSFKFKIRITGETPADGNKRNNSTSKKL